MKTLQSIVIILVASFSLLSSCNKEDKVSPAQSRQKVIYDDGVTSINGIPLYENFNGFAKQLNLNRNSVERAKFETKYKFTSLLTAYGQAISNTNYKSTGPTSLIIVSNEGSLKLNANNYGYASLINSDGLAIIGAGIYRFEASQIFSLPLTEGIRLSDAVTILTSSNPATKNKQVKTDVIHTVPVKRNDVKSQSVPAGNSFRNDRYTLHSSGAYTSFFMDSQLQFGWVGGADYYCSQQEFDPESGQFYCPEENTVYTGYYNIAGISIQSTISRQECVVLEFGSCSTSNANAYIVINEAFGNFNYILNGSTYNTPFYTSTQDSFLYYNVVYNKTYTNGQENSDFEVTNGQANYHCGISATGGGFNITGNMNLTLVP